MNGERVPLEQRLGSQLDPTPLFRSSEERGKSGDVSVVDGRVCFRGLGGFLHRLSLPRGVRKGESVQEFGGLLTTVLGRGVNV